MFNYPGLKPRPIKSASQYCCNCSKWFSLGHAQIGLLSDLWNQMYKNKNCALEVVDCIHCGACNTLVPVGKYDAPNTRQELCAVQCTTLES